MLGLLAPGVGMGGGGGATLVYGPLRVCAVDVMIPYFDTDCMIPLMPADVFVPWPEVDVELP